MNLLLNNQPFYKGLWAALGVVSAFVLLVYCERVTGWHACHTDDRTTNIAVSSRHGDILMVGPGKMSCGLTVVRRSSLDRTIDTANIRTMRFHDAEIERGVLALFLDEYQPQELVFIECRVSVSEIITIARYRRIKWLLFTKCIFDADAIEKVCLLQSLKSLGIYATPDLDLTEVRKKLEGCLSDVEIDM